MKFDQLKKIMLLSQGNDDCKISYRLFKILESIKETNDFNYEIRISIVINKPITIKISNIIQYELPNGNQKLIMSAKYDFIMELIDYDSVSKVDVKDYNEF